MANDDFIFFSCFSRSLIHRRHHLWVRSYTPHFHKHRGIIKIVCVFVHFFHFSISNRKVFAFASALELPLLFYVRGLKIKLEERPKFPFSQNGMCLLSVPMCNRT